MYDEPLRPDPDQLLAQVTERPRGKLKIFFGACAGVGKTYAMLKEAQRLREQGIDVLAGVVETHGRSETAALLEGLRILPLKKHNYRGRQVAGFDLDRALAIHPAVILMDELAHTNIPGARHPKRWQDVEELLNAGIDVLTTINVQHLESLNDIVGGVTGVRVRETVPDPVFDAADEIVLVDLTPDDLLDRLREGKVYLPAQAERAIEHFFRKGNLLALRELALRRTTDRVDEQMRAWRERKGQEKVWHTRDAILVCLRPDGGNEKLVRAAARLAARLGSDWHAIFVETPARHKLPSPQRRTILTTLSLAQQLGATTATLAEPEEGRAVIRYARENNLGKIMIVRHERTSWWRRDKLQEQLSRSAADLDVVMIAPQDRQPENREKFSDNRPFLDKHKTDLQGCVVAALICAVTTLMAHHWLMAFDNANLVMLYILGVVVVARFYGRWPSVFATIINVISFDIFLINPKGTLAVSDMQYLLTFAVMMTVGLVIGSLTAGVRYQARVARYREQRTWHLYEMSKALAVARESDDIASVSCHFISHSLHARCEMLLPDEQGNLIPAGGGVADNGRDDAIIRWSYDKGQPAGFGTGTLPGVPYQILPVCTTEKVYGVVIVEPYNRRQLLIPEQQRLLETLILLAAGALERRTLTEREAQSRLVSEREQVRNSLLAALSHDLRTPLTVLFGQAEILTLDLTSEGSPYAAQANEIRQHILSTTRLVNNLLDMARIQSGGFNLNKEWLPLEEVIGSALQMLKPRFDTDSVQIDLNDPMQLICADGPLFERVLINLLENAIKYAGPQAQIGIRSRLSDNMIDIEVWDNGSGIPAGQEAQIFEKFSRGQKESAIPGIGLGLAICRAIAEVHGGTILAGNRDGGGASFHIRLPCEDPPVIDEDDNPL